MGSDYPERPPARFPQAGELAEAATAAAFVKPEPSQRHDGGSEATLPRGPELSIIIPTFNEVANVPEIVRRLRICLPSVA